MPEEASPVKGSKQKSFFKGKPERLKSMSPTKRAHKMIGNFKIEFDQEERK